MIFSCTRSWQCHAMDVHATSQRSQPHMSRRGFPVNSMGYPSIRDIGLYKAKDSAPLQADATAWLPYIAPIIRPDAADADNPPSASFLRFSWNSSVTATRSWISVARGVSLSSPGVLMTPSPSGLGLRYERVYRAMTVLKLSSSLWSWWIRSS